MVARLKAVTFLAWLSERKVPPSKPRSGWGVTFTVSKLTSVTSRRDVVLGDDQ